MSIQPRRGRLAWAIEIALATASRSRDPSTKVGAIILRPDKSVISLGYNGFPRTMPDKEEWLADRAEKLDRTVHAELNAIIQARASVEGCVMAVTHPPCKVCAIHIIAAGIKEVAWPTPTADFLSRWNEDYLRTKQLFRDSGVDFKEYPNVGTAPASESDKSSQES